jgi:hypothetical protein
MYGSCWRLPAIALLLLPAALSGQIGRPQPSQEPARPAREFEPAPAPDIPSAPQPPHSPTSPPGTFGFPQLVQSAGIIFSGRVTAIAHPAPSAGHAVETVAITFHVDQAIRGAARARSRFRNGWACGPEASVTASASVCCCFFIPPANWDSPAASAARWAASPSIPGAASCFRPSNARCFHPAFQPILCWEANRESASTISYERCATPAGRSEHSR